MADALADVDDARFVAECVESYLTADASARADIAAFFESDGPAKVQVSKAKEGLPNGWPPDEEDAG